MRNVSWGKYTRAARCTSLGVAVHLFRLLGLALQASLCNIYISILIRTPFVLWIQTKICVTFDLKGWLENYQFMRCVFCIRGIPLGLQYFILSLKDKIVYTRH